MPYWYYNWPAIDKITPNRGPETGNTTITLQGRNFNPFKEHYDEVDNRNDTFCGFVDLKIKMPAIVHNGINVTCVTPASFQLRQTKVEITLNNLEYTEAELPEDEVIFYYYKPPFLFDIDPPEGPVRGGTLVTLLGSNYEDTG